MQDYNHINFLKDLADLVDKYHVGIMGDRDGNLRIYFDGNMMRSMEIAFIGGESKALRDFISIISKDFVENCHCAKCNPFAWWMIVCPDCGSKRCARALSHLNGCDAKIWTI